MRAPLLASRERTDEQWVCACCKKLFIPTYRQANNKRWQKKTVFVCSLTCRGRLNSEVRINNGQLKRSSKKASARLKIRDAVLAGELIRPNVCERCGKEKLKTGPAGIHAHHYKGYDFPLDVQWLCAACHAGVEIETRFKRGSQHKTAKLTESDIPRIRYALGRGDSLISIAEVFCVSKKTIFNIKHGLIWKHVS